MLRPQTSASRELLNLDGIWDFKVDFKDEGFAKNWASKPLETDLDIAVPSSYNDLFTSVDIREHVGWVWYQRTVRVPRGWASDRVMVRIDAATHAGVVFVNGKQVAEHPDKLEIVKLNVDENPQTAMTYGITSIPAMKVFQNGEVVKTVIGAKPKPALEADLAAFIG